MKTETTDFIKITAEAGYELFNGEVATNTISAPVGTDLSQWIERKATRVYEFGTVGEAQQLYDALIEQGKSIFETYRIKLIQVSYEDIIRGTVSAEFKGLVTALEQVKDRIKNHLKIALENNDIEALKSFSYQTDEAKQLDSAINAFQK